MPANPKQYEDGAWSSMQSNCNTCNATFSSKRRRKPDGTVYYDKLCGKTCREIHVKERQDTWPKFVCFYCKQEFQLGPSSVKLRENLGGSPKFCTKACQTKGAVGAHNSSYQTGETLHHGTKEKYILHRREGYIGRYVGKHRLIVEGSDGRIDKLLVPEDEFYKHFNNWELTSCKQIPTLMVVPFMHMVNKKFPDQKITMFQVEDVTKDGKAFNHVKFGFMYDVEGGCFMCKFKSKGV